MTTPTLPPILRPTALLFLAALLAGCGESDTPAPQDNAITFSTPSLLGDGTRLTTTEDTGTDGNGQPTTYTTTFDPGDRIGIYAYYLPGGNEANGQEFMVNQEVKYNNSKQWEYSPTKYWPNAQGDELSFYAYYPYSGTQNNVSASASTLAYSPCDGKTDLLWASAPKQRKPASGGAVDLDFRHQLSSIRFKLTNSWTDGTYTLKVNYIKFSATVNTGVDIDLESGAQTPKNAAKADYLPDIAYMEEISSGASSTESVADPIFMIPSADVADAVIELGVDFYKDGVKLTHGDAPSYVAISSMLPKKTFEKGTSYTYNLMFSPTAGIQVLSVTETTGWIQVPNDNHI